MCAITPPRSRDVKPDPRDHYRTLQVRPDARPEVIKASWRALMHAARVHPDLGGDTAEAARLNEAYAVLSDPERRRAYDARRGPGTHRDAGATSRAPGERSVQRSTPAWRTDPTGDAAAQARRVDRFEPSGTACPMCREPLPAIACADARCRRCDAPLAPAATSRGAGNGPADRPHLDAFRGDAAVVRVDWRTLGMPARLAGVSIDAVDVLVPGPIEPGATIRIVLPTLDAVCRVLACHLQHGACRVRAQWLTALALDGPAPRVRVTA
jgi:hypothetical protein